MLIGDGKTKLGNLILNDPRARIIADVYFARHSDKLSNILRAGEKFLLSECGNHCQGAIFLNGKFLKTPELEQAIHQIALTIPHFFFGRFDIRYRDQDALKNGRNFEIVEINGAGSEATHIWDAHTSITEAYRTLFAQWRHIFEIGLYVKARKIKAKVDLKKFVKECLKVMRRKDPLSVSS